VTAIPNIVLIAGFVLGLVFGSIALLSGFCVTSGLRNWWMQGDGRLIRTVALALAVAIVGTQILAAGGLVDLGQSIYLAPSFSAALILCGGLLFGYGMVAANGCVSRALVLLGRGNLRSLVVVATVAVSAEVTLKGLLAPVRLALLQWSQTPAKIRSLPDLLVAHGLAAAPARLVAAVAVAGVLSVFVFAHAPLRRATGQIAAGIAIGLLIPAGWFATGYLGADPFNPAPAASLTFVAPSADSLQYAMFSTGSTLSFGVTLVAGVVLGSFLTALATRHFRFEGYESAGHMLRSIGGAALMGSGGAMALGCTIGQGLTGLSTLALPSVLAVTGILLGAAAALRSPIRISGLASAASAPARRP
jgi:uncharacterized membrane protein YedE/YeeE